MKQLRAAPVLLLITIAYSLTFNLDDNPGQAPTVLIFRKSKPSLLIFPSNETLTLNYPHRQEYTKFQLTSAEPTITFSSLKKQVSKDIQEAKPVSTNKVGINKGKVTANPKNESLNQIQPPAEKQGPRKSKSKPESSQVPSKYPSLAGSYYLLHPESFNLQATIPITINSTHITYTVCSKNTCLYLQEKGTVDFGSCEMISRPECPPFGDLFYADMRILAQLQLIQSFKREDGKYKFYDKESALRLQLQKGK